MSRRRGTRAGIVCLSVSLLGGLAEVQATGAASAAPVIEAAAPAAEGALFGAYRQPRTGWVKEQVQASITQLESDLGRNLDIDHHYYHWDWAFPDWKQAWDADNGRISMVSWAGIETSRINSGSQDDWIAARADAVRDYGYPMFLRWFWEMDATTSADRVGSASAYVDAWRHIHDIFTAHGATNALWVWCPDAYAFDKGIAAKYYPGDAYVDWICADGYNWAPAVSTTKWKAFAKIFASFYTWGLAHGKPLMVGETGVMERNSGEKAQWLTDAGAALKTTYPAIRAFVYFDAMYGSNFGGMYDWRVDTSTSSYNAYKALAADPYFNPDHAAILGSTVPAASTLTVTTEGAGVGSVTSIPSGISCPPTCTQTFDPGTEVALTASPGTNSRFAGWSGSCSGTASCALTMVDARSLSARFRSMVPKPKLTHPQKTFQGAPTFEVSWRGPSAASSFDFLARKLRRSGHLGRNTRKVKDAAITGLSLHGKQGRTYCMFVRAKSPEGELSPWSTRRCTAVPLDDRSLRRVGHWRHHRARSAFLHTYSVTRHFGVVLTRGGIRARRLALVVTKCPSCGKVRVLWRGHLLRRIHLRARRTKPGVVVPLAVFRHVKRGRIEIQVLSRGKPVMIDGVGVSRA